MKFFVSPMPSVKNAWGFIVENYITLHTKVTRK